MTRSGAPKGATAITGQGDHHEGTTPLRQQRDPYAEVGQAMRQSIERAARAELGERDRRVHAAVLVLTVSWSRLADETSVRQVAAIAYGIDRDAVTGWHRKRVAESLRKLTGLGIVAYAAGRGPGARCTVEIEAAPRPRVPLVTESYPAAGSNSTETHPAAARKAPYGRAERHPAAAATPRSKPEQPPEQPQRGDEVDETAAALLAHHGITANAGSRSRLRDEITAQLDAGWTAPAIRGHASLREPITGARRPDGALAARVRDLGAPPRERELASARAHARNLRTISGARGALTAKYERDPELLAAALAALDEDWIDEHRTKILGVDDLAGDSAGGAAA